ncbi:hypothetical protein IL252_08045 [Halomicrobium sp. IBSBa]|uniref:DUF7473 family protein n=1 Tax=Halomicrobium sp. IBSBa TaxID=2778916 RepID=UPI001ABF10F8|nr:hypothetical protein [Halomicrobium sp. IBSBa]MBO4247764.1 hypothetical protein [Halomicrobium sp. IBSBa]
MFGLLQTGIAGGGLVAIAVTLLVTWLFYGVTLHLAAVFFIGEVPSQRAAYAAIAPAVVSLLLQQYTGAGLLVLVTIAATLATDLFSISYVYRLKWRSAMPLVALHFAFAGVLGFAFNNIFGLV